MTLAAVLLAGTIAGAQAAPSRSVSLLRAIALKRLVKLDVRAPQSRRWRIYVDGRLDGFGVGATGFARVTRPGRHSIYVALAPGNRSRTVRVRLARAGGRVVAAAGDIACDPGDQFAFNGGLGTAHQCHDLRTSNLLVHAGLTAVLALGDLQYYCGSAESFALSYDSSWGRVKAITRPTPGNHEYQTRGSSDCAPGAKGYFSYWGAAAGDPRRGYYSFEIGSWHLVSLNSNCAQIGGCGAGSPQEQWLRDDLAAHPRLCTLAFWHQPPFASRVSPRGTPPKTIALLQDLYDAGAEVLLNGDEHHYERFAPQTPQGADDPARGIREFVVGTGGKDLRRFGPPVANSEVRQDKTFGVLELTLRPASYAWQFIPEAGGRFTDSGSSACHRAG